LQISTEYKDVQIETDFELLRPIINENLNRILNDNISKNPPQRYTSEKSIPTPMYDRSEGADSRNNYLKRDDSQNTYEPNYIQNTEVSENLKPVNNARGSVLQEYTSNSPILSKNSVHHMSNNSTVLPSSIKHDFSHLGVRRRNDTNNSPSNPRDLNNSVEFTDEIQNTQRSDDYLNTSTDLEPSHRQSVYQIGNKKKSGRSQQASIKNKQAMMKLSQQPGYIDRDQAIIEQPNREELVSNPKSREQSHQSMNRRKVKISNILEF